MQVLRNGVWVVFLVSFQRKINFIWIFTYQVSYIPDNQNKVLLYL